MGWCTFYASGKTQHGRLLWHRDKWKHCFFFVCVCTCIVFCSLMLLMHDLIWNEIAFVCFRYEMYFSLKKAALLIYLYWKLPFLFNGVPGNLIILFHVVVLVAQLTFYFCCAVFEIMIIQVHKSGHLYFITFTALKKKKYMCEQMVRSHDWSRSLSECVPHTIHLRQRKIHTV